MSDPVSRRRDDPENRLGARKGLYILPSMFTAANIAAGYYAISQAIQGTAMDPWHFDQAAKAIGFAVLFDGFDGRIARMTNTVSAFGRELDSLADVIAFGVAPAILAWLWGFHALPLMGETDLRIRIIQLGAVATFLFLMTGAARLARFNIQTNPQPSNPGRPGKKYFVGLPIPGGAGVVAAVVHLVGGSPLQSWYLSIGWGVFVFAIAFLMVSTWRFYSFKDLNLGRPQNFRFIILIGFIIAMIWFESRYVLFGIAMLYILSGVIARLSFVFRRPNVTPLPPSPPHDEVSRA
jgi:CDP-diacylglycerol--serine O-phosphatidyltransferase